MDKTPTTAALDAVAMTRTIAHLFWNGDTEGCAALLADDFIWVAAQEEQYRIDAAAFREEHAAIFRTMPHAILMQEEYEEIAREGRLHVVIGRYLYYTAPELSMVFASQQRLTLVWREEDAGDGVRDAGGGGAGRVLRLVHLHASNPLDAPRKGEHFPTSYAKETHRYASLIASQKSYQNTCVPRDAGGVTHLVRLYEVAYLEAARQSTVVHLLARDLRVRGGISQVAQTIMGAGGRGLVQTHRGYYVNVLHVDEIGGDEVLLTDGRRVPVSGRRTTEVRDEIVRERLAPDAAAEG